MKASNKKGLAGISVLPSWDLLEAYLPLLSESRVDCLEVTLDSQWKTAAPEPEWYLRLQEEFSRAGRLSGHALDFSPFASLKEDEQNLWLARLKRASKGRRFSQLSAHFGLQRGGLFSRTAPFPVPYCKSALELGQAQMKRLAEAAHAPVGLENLALAFSLDEVKRQGEFLERLLEPVNGFLLLDLHNLYCQSRNFSVPVEELLAALPLGRVKELHLSGGSWTNHGLRTLRRDTHDGPVPADCFLMLDQTLPHVPDGVLVVLERLPGTAIQPGSREELRRSFAAIERRCSAPQEREPARPAMRMASAGPALDGDIEAYQTELLKSLTAPGTEECKAALLDNHALAPYHGYVRAMETEMLDIARELLWKWSEPKQAGQAERRKGRKGTRQQRLAG